MRIFMNMEKLEAKRLEEGISKRDMAEIAGSGRPTYYFDLLRHRGRTNKEDRAVRLALWYGSIECICPWSIKRHFKDGLVL